MSIKTPGTSESNTFKTSTPALSGGFITNDATGLFEYDQGGVGTPVGASQWEFIEEKSITGNVGSITFSGLDGDIDKMYKIVMQRKAPPAGPFLPRWRIRPNNIFSSVSQQTTTHQMRQGSPRERIFIDPGLVFYLFSNGSIQTTTYFNAESGKIRTMRSRFNFLFLDALAFNPLVRTSDHFSVGFWDDSTTVVTSLVLDNDIFPSGGAGGTWNPGDRVKLYKLSR